MPSVIDSLVLEFNLDTSQFTREQQRLMDQIAKMSEHAHTQAVDVEGSLKRVVGVFSNLQRMGLASIAGFFGFQAGQEIIQMVDHFARLDQQVGRLSQTVNMNKADVLAWRNAFRAAGFSAESGMEALNVVNQQVIGYTQYGQVTDLARFAAARGVNIANAQGQPRAAGDILIDIASALDRAHLTPQQRGGLLARSGLPFEAQQMLMRSAEEITRIVNEQKKLIPTPEDTARSNAFIESLAKVQTAFEKMGFTLTTRLEPSLTKFADWFTAFLDKFSFGDTDLIGKAATATGATGFRDWIRRHLTPAGVDFAHRLGLGRGAAAEDDAERKKFIEDTSRALGLDPAVTLQVWSSEGRYGIGPRRQSTIAGEQSFGDFQLHYGGGLADLYTRETGHQAGDPRFWREEDAWALRHMRMSPEGLAPWHGWRGDPKAGGAGGGAQHVSFNIQTMNVNGENAKEVASNLGAQLRRQQIAMLGNSGAV